MLSTVSIMPGIDSRAPDRHETSSGLFAEPNSAPMIFSTCLSAASTCFCSSLGYVRSLA